MRGTVRVKAALALIAAMAASSCSTALPGSVSSAPVLSVVTAAYPLAQAAAMIGGTKVTVDDVVPAGTDPLTYSPGPADRHAITTAGLVLQVGGGFQPAFEAASAGARRVLSLARQVAAGGQYPWLDPATMAQVVSATEAAMVAADPPAAPLFRRNAAGVQAQISSLGIDYSSTLSACPGSTIVTPVPAFTPLAASYTLRDLIVPAAPDPARVAAAVSAVRAAPAAAVLALPWVDDAGVAEVAAGAGARLHRAETLVGAPAGGWPRGSDYFALMEQNLGVISSGLGCTSEQ